MMMMMIIQFYEVIQCPEEDDHVCDGANPFLVNFLYFLGGRAVD